MSAHPRRVGATRRAAPTPRFGMIHADSVSVEACSFTVSDGPKTGNG